MSLLLFLFKFYMVSVIAYMIFSSLLILRVWEEVKELIKKDEELKKKLSPDSKLSKLLKYTFKEALFPVSNTISAASFIIIFVVVACSQSAREQFAQMAVTKMREKYNCDKGTGETVCTATNSDLLP